MNHAQAQAHRHAWLAAHPGALDAGETNLYRSLPAHCPEWSPAPLSPDPQARYRCHVAEAFLDWLGWPVTPGADWRHRVGISAGVRDSLGLWMTELARLGKRLALPREVYPVYAQLAVAAGVDTLWYSALAPRTAQELDQADAWLVCDPLKPWGGAAVHDHDLTLWHHWADQDPDRVLLVDAVYALRSPSAPVRFLVHEQIAGLLTSLSKNWVLPQVAGVCVMPEVWAERLRPRFAERPKDENRLRQAFGALTQGRAIPNQVHHWLADQAARWQPWLAAHPAWQCSPIEGYFWHSPLPPEHFRAQGIWVLPATVFGDPHASGSVGSTLPAAPPIA